MKRLILVFFVWFFGASCNQNAQSGIIEKDKMIAVLTDVHLVDGYIASYMQDDSVKQTASDYYSALYKHHEIDSITYKKSLIYYSRNPKLLDTIYHQVNLNLDALQKFETEKHERERIDYENYINLKEETKGTLFKPYTIWFFRFTMPETFYGRTAPVINHTPRVTDSVEVYTSTGQQKAKSDSISKIFKKNLRKRFLKTDSLKKK